MGYIIGHLHPALVHLPIGFIILALLTDFFRHDKAKSIRSFLWIASAVASIFAMTTGLILLRSGYYEGANMFIHLLCGYGIAIVCSLIAFSHWKDKQWFSNQHLVSKVALLGLLIVGGHKGGELTHGPEYLPTPFSKIETLNFDTIDVLDSINVYGHMIQQIFQLKCNRCHEPEDARGKLDMTSEEGLLDDTYGDPGIAPGNMEDSEIFKRITLAPSHRKFMPPSGPELSYKEKKLVEWWINKGAPFSSNLRTSVLTDEDRAFFDEQFGIDLREKSFYEKVFVNQVDESALTQIRDNEFNVTPLASTNNFLDVSRVGKPKDVTAQELKALVNAKQQITWLDLSSSAVGDDIIPILGDLQNLTKLKLQNTNITDETLRGLTDLSNLQVLNVYGTGITDEGLKHLQQLSSLQKLFVWQTNVTDAGITALQNALPNLEIVSGI